MGRGEVTSASNSSVATPARRELSEICLKKPDRVRAASVTNDFGLHLGSSDAAKSGGLDRSPVKDKVMRDEIGANHRRCAGLLIREFTSRGVVG